MSIVWNENDIIEAERQRAELEDILTDKGITVQQGETLGNMIPLVNQLRKDDFFSKLANGTLDEIEDEYTTVIKTQLFKNVQALTKVNMPNVTTVQGEGLRNCTALRHLNLPKLASLQGNEYYYIAGCTSLKVAYFPSFITGGILYYMLSGCSNLEKIIMPKCENITVNGLSGATNKLKLTDSKLVLTTSSSTLIETIILRKTSVVTLSNTNLIPNNNCQIYVPQNLIETYKTATNWSALPNIADRLHAIEGSSYEQENWYEGTQDYITEVLGE